MTNKGEKWLSHEIGWIEGAAPGKSHLPGLRVSVRVLAERPWQTQKIWLKTV